MTLNRDLELLYEVGCLRFVQRTWRQFLNADFANLAEHTLHVMWIALILAYHEQARLKKTGYELDTGKLVKMGLIHDLSESRSVDVHYLSRQYADRHEVAATQDTLAGTIVEADLLKLAEEYEHRQSWEAKIVKDADNLNVDFELAEQTANGVQLAKNWTEMRQQVAETKLYTPTAKKIWQAIQKSNPHDWHLHGKNRFSSGDWKK